MRLFPDPPAPLPESVDLRCCDVAEVLEAVTGAALVHADPPWSYRTNPARSCAGNATGYPEDVYPTLTMEQIRGHLRAAHEVALPGARLVVWATWPTLPEYVAEDLAPWRWVTGGAWTKRAQGIGFHWLGRSEPVLVYTKQGATTTHRRADLGNAYTSVPGAHSVKPARWLCRMLERWTNPGDLVVDLYAGMAPMAHACRATGRRYVGAEIDPDRYQRARGLLATRASTLDVLG